MTFAIRCHALIKSGKVFGNVVITYDGTREPSQNVPVDTVVGKNISFAPCTCETHSTVDYNGIAVIGLQDVVDMKLSLADLSHEVSRLASMTENIVYNSDQSQSITFYRLG